MKTDLRVIKSHAAIENAFINLVEIKGYSNITIKEIAEKALVNRNTIYLNYGSKEGILDAIVKTSIRKYFGQLNSQYFKVMGLNKRKIEMMYRNLFKVVDENIELYRIIITDAASSGFLNPEFSKLRKEFLELIKPNSENKIKVSFLINGVFGILTNYITLATGTAEENIKILTDLTYSNLRHLSYSR
ncbi:MAG: TetR/AcrR family transcriptional regulator [Bacilli bacterium]|nr:TetR/AcrR family transcriptional regulator [Bacilli bacterium]